MKGFWRIHRHPRSGSASAEPRSPAAQSPAAQSPAAQSPVVRSPVARADTSEGTEPDPRFTFANERTFLAWGRTALALVAAGLAITQFLPPFPGIPWGRHVIGVPLIALGAVVAVVGYLEWDRAQRALRLGRPLPRTILPQILTVVVAAECVLAAALVIFSGVGR